VTPAIALSTAAVFAAYDAGARPAGAGATRLSSTHLAAELGGGLTSARLVERAGILAVANDLFAAAAAIVPALIPFRRGLARVLGRPVGQSGSGPTAWALYPSPDEAAGAAEVVRSALRDGRLASPGAGEPSIIATSIASTTEGS
jgi:4-diphosphocytidyl-2C-methyl-D-erythritol kinase